MKTEMTINVRPLRHVYFIAEDDLKRFTEVATFCCTQWGGINNLIIPIPINERKGTENPFTNKDSFFVQNIKRRNPDIFIDAVATKEKQNTFYSLLTSWLRSQYPSKPVIEWETFLTTDLSLHPLSLALTQSNASKQVLSSAVFYTGSTVSELDLAIRSAAFGSIWPGQEHDYREIYELRQWPIDVPGASLHAQLTTDPCASVINLTLKEMRNIGTEDVFSSPHFDVVIAQAVGDLCWFWNLRAYSFGHQWLTDRRVLILSKNQFLQETYFEPLLRIVREHRIHPYIKSNIDVIFHYNQDPEIHQFLQSHSELQELQGDLELVMRNHREVSNNVGDSDADVGISRPVIYAENVLSSLSVYHEYGGNRPTVSLTLTEDSESFLVPSAGPQTLNYGNVQVGLQSELWDQFPCHSSVANLIIPNSSFNMLQDTIELNYQHTFPILQGLQRVSIKIPKTWDIYQAYFRALGYEVSLSDKSFYANGLIGIAGGLEQAKIFCSHIAYRILDILADKSSPKLARELYTQLSQQGFNLPYGFEEYMQGVVIGTGVIPQFKRNPRTFTKIKEALDRDEKPQCLKVLSELVKIKAVQRGLDVKCPHCQTTIWYSIGDLDERMKCLGCLETFDLPLAEDDLDTIDRTFQYSLNPLANRAMDQDILPVITALLTLKTVHAHMYHMVPGMNFKPMGSTNNTGDFDFVYTYKHKLYGGECKSGEMLSQKDVNTARVARQLGFRAFFFVTVKTFRDEAKELIRSYQQELANDVNTDRPYTIDIVQISPFLIYSGHDSRRDNSIIRSPTQASLRAARRSHRAIASRPSTH